MYTDTLPQDITANKKKTGIFVRNYEDSSKSPVLIIQGYTDSYGRVNTESHYSFDPNGEVVTIKMANGTTFKSPALVLDQAQKFTYHDDGSVDVNTARFNNPNFSDPKKPWSVETGTYDAEGNYVIDSNKTFLIPEDACLASAPTGSGGGQDTPNQFEIYKNILSAMSDQKISTQGGKSYNGYKGFEYFNKGRIDTSKCMNYDNSNAYYSIVVDGTAVQITIPDFKLSPQGIDTDNWTYSFNIDTPEGKYSALGVGSETFNFNPKTGVNINAGNYNFYGEGENVSLYTPNKGVITDVTVNLKDKTIVTNDGSTFVSDGNKATAYLGAGITIFENQGGAFGVAMTNLADVVIPDALIIELADDATQIATWMLAVGQSLTNGDGSYGQGMLATNVGLKFDVSKGTIEATIETETAIQDQRDRLATMNDATATTSQKNEALEAFYDNMPKQYRDYLESLGITSASQLEIGPDGLVARNVVDVSQVNLPTELNGCKLDYNIPEGTKFDLVIKFDGTAFIRTTGDLFTLVPPEGSDISVTDFTGNLEVAIEVDRTGNGYTLRQTGVINYVIKWSINLYTIQPPITLNLILV